jgi:murein DD-endopeptidase MepM/ murein hydrolase activator NlpD
VTELAKSVATARPARRVLRRGVIVGAVVGVLCLMCVGGTTLSLLGGLFGQTPVATSAFGCGNGKAVDPTGPMPAVSGLVEDQVRDAAIIIKVGQDMQVPARGWVIGIATALQESRLFNLPDLGSRNDHDSIGLFQQRPSAGWGTPEQLRDPAYQARKFFAKLLTISNWQTLPLTVAAQRVQISAFPNAYAKHEPLASAIVDVLTGGASRSAVDVAAALQCVAAGEIAASGWTVPVKGPITSGFRPPSRPTHNGVDIGVPKGTAIHAASSGIVLVATCQAHIGPAAYSCDRDGGLFVAGCGWYVDILHAGNVITRYCHQMVRPYVKPGQSVAAGEVIGLSGASGNASGPHLHFEVHLNGDPGPLGAVDPIPYMNQVGAPLVGSE